MTSLPSIAARLPSNVPQPARPAATRRLPLIISPAKAPMIGPNKESGQAEEQAASDRPENRTRNAPTVAPKRRAP